MSRKVIQSDRLRDQVYRLLREDLFSGVIPAGSRLVELELAERYGVSRTPVREALFQLAREGLLEQSERGYSLIADTPQDFLQRMGVRLLLDPPLAEHAARFGTEEQLDSLEAVFGRMKKAAEQSKFIAFVAAAHEFRTLLLEMCHNTPLAKVCAVLEDQFLLVRNEYYRDESNRAISIERDGQLVDAIKARDSKAAARAAKDYVETLIDRYSPEAKRGKARAKPDNTA
ncbi:hypothetical protein A6V36_18085 [Paraburkholderia ginsengiterrae]|uniref:HTH gntR-type domain-containing protein n=2 Tax=Paraburkholderia ginsengiterrae TaxID=1462993 RepID=A0A1A9MYN0_9BURK|nr:hypothetical protein A6V37_10265 [Paraburkholderia ginsengiterrae]OAJ63404.1 hypothetical protein A6V36_18085 [Paraburkholderia ginsengiterrae]